MQSCMTSTVTMTGFQKGCEHFNVLVSEVNYRRSSFFRRAALLLENTAEWKYYSDNHNSAIFSILEQNMQRIMGIIVFVKLNLESNQHVEEFMLLTVDFDQNQCGGSNQILL